MCEGEASVRRYGGQVIADDALVVRVPESLEQVDDEARRAAEVEVHDDVQDAWPVWSRLRLLYDVRRR